MTAYDILLAVGAGFAALAVGIVCGVGVLVWFSGRPRRARPSRG